MTIVATLFNDPGCPWGYSANPALTVLRWRYAEGIEWRIVSIGLTERAEQYEQRGYTAAMMARSQLSFRRFGMPFSPTPKARVAATARACRAMVATRLAQPDREWAVMRALQFAQFTSPSLLDDDEALLAPLESVDGLDAARILAALDDPDVTAAYEADRAEARTAAGSPTEFQGKAARSDGPVRYTAPSVVFEAGGRRLEAGGFQPLEAYDVLVANLDRTLERTPPPEDPRTALEAFPDGLVTQEVAALLARGNDAPDRAGAELALVELAAAGAARRVPWATTRSGRSCGCPRRWASGPRRARAARAAPPRP